MKMKVRILLKIMFFVTIALCDADIYFGTNEIDVINASDTSPEFLGNQVDTFFIRNGFYSMDNYYWRVDIIDLNGDTTKGDVWYFKKRIKAFPKAEGYGGYAIGGRGVR